MLRNKHLDTVKDSNCNHYRICSGDQIEKNEMGGACGTYAGEERRIQGFGGET